MASVWLNSILEKNSADPRIRLEVGQELLNQISSTRLPSDARTLNDFCDIIYQWISASNFKVALLALEILQTAVKVSGDVLAPYMIERISHLVERLGDSKVDVRDSTVYLLSELASVPHSSPQLVLEKISSGFEHKQWIVRMTTMQAFRLLLEENREDLEIQTNRLIPILCKLMSDPNSEVRDAASKTIVHIMLILGENIGLSIRNGRLLPDNKMSLLMQRYDDTLRNGISSQSPRSTRIARPTRKILEPRISTGGYKYGIFSIYFLSLLL